MGGSSHLASGAVLARSSGHILGFDGIRAIAVLAVIWDHTYFSWEGLPISRRGFLGVDLFFVLSGFLITWLLLVERAKNGSISLLKFYIRRTLRIFPLYFAVIGALAAYFFLAPETSTQREAFLRELPYHLTYTSNWIVPSSMMGITWSLSTEEQFYLVWPLLFVLLASQAARMSILVLLVSANQLVNFRLLDGWFSRVGFPYASLEIVQCTFTPLLLGVIAAHLVHDQYLRRFVERYVSSGYVAVASLTVFLLAANWAGEIRGAPRLVVHVSATILLVWVFVNRKHAAVQILEAKPLAYVGAISYGIYLLHLPVMYVAGLVLDRISMNTPVTLFLAGAGGSIVVAGLSFRFFERPFLNLKSKFSVR